MKKQIAVFLLAAAFLMLAACGSRQQSPEPDYPGIYGRTWSEEIGGTTVQRKAYVVLNEDHTGCWIAQDIGDLTWEEGRITLAIGETFDIALTRENGAVKLLVYEFPDETGKGTPRAYEKTDALPPEIEEMLASR